MNKNNIEHCLGAQSKIYYKQVHVYELFSKAEDKPNLVGTYLSEKINNKLVLDIGCGTGKYLDLLAPVTKKYVGIDCSKEMLIYAQQKSKNHLNSELIHKCAENAQFKDASFDIALATWVIESIRDEQVQYAIIQNIENALKQDGTFFIIENKGDSEFEKIIQRYPNISTTKNTSKWLLKKGFEKTKTIESYFLFESTKQAKQIFSKIWGVNISERIRSNKIEQNINIYKKVKQ